MGARNVGELAVGLVVQMGVMGESVGGDGSGMGGLDIELVEWLVHIDALLSVSFACSLCPSFFSCTLLLLFEVALLQSLLQALQLL